MLNALCDELVLSSVVPEQFCIFTSPAQTTNAFCKGKHFSSYTFLSGIRKCILSYANNGRNLVNDMLRSLKQGNSISKLFVPLFFMTVCIILPALMYTVSPFC